MVSVTSSLSRALAIIHSLSPCLPGAYYVPGTVPGTHDTAMTETGKTLALVGAFALVEINTINK